MAVFEKTGSLNLSGREVSLELERMMSIRADDNWTEQSCNPTVAGIKVLWVFACACACARNSATELLRLIFLRVFSDLLYFNQNTSSTCSSSQPVLLFLTINFVLYLLRAQR